MIIKFENDTKIEIPDVFNTVENCLAGIEGITALIGTDTLWRNTKYLKARSWVGKLQTVSFDRFQSGVINTIRAVYKVKGYKYPVLVWFNLDGTRKF